MAKFVWEMGVGYTTGNINKHLTPRNIWCCTPVRMVDIAFFSCFLYVILSSQKKRNETEKEEEENVTCKTLSSSTMCSLTYPWSDDEWIKRKRMKILPMVGRIQFPFTFTFLSCNFFLFQFFFFFFSFERQRFLNKYFMWWCYDSVPFKWRCERIYVFRLDTITCLVYIQQSKSLLRKNRFLIGVKLEIWMIYVIWVVLRMNFQNEKFTRYEWETLFSNFYLTIVPVRYCNEIKLIDKIKFLKKTT